MLMFIKTGQRRDVPEMSRRLGQRHYVTERLDFRRRDVESNVATFLRGIISTLRRWNPTSRRFREVLFQCRDAGFQHRDVEKRYIFNVAMLQKGIYFNVTTLSLTSRHYRDQQLEIFYKKFSKCRKLPKFSSTHPKLAQSFPCYLSFTKTTSEPRSLQHKYIKIKTSKLKPSKLKTRKTDDQNYLKAWVASQVALCLLSLARPSCVFLTSAQPQTTSG